MASIQFLGSWVSALKKLLIALSLVVSTARADFLLQDGDTIAFLGSGGVQQSRLLPNHPQIEALEKRVKGIDDALVTLQRAAAKPYPYRFEIRKAASPPKKTAD